MSFINRSRVGQISATVLLVVFVSQVAAQQNRVDIKQKDADPKKLPDYFFDQSDELVEAQVIENPLLYDADLRSIGGDLWYAWLEFTPGKGDQIWVGSRDQEKWKTRSLATDVFGEYANPTLTVDGKQRVWLSYEARNKDQWDVFVVSLREGAPIETARRVSPGEGADLHHAVAADSTGGLWFAWQSDRNGQFDIVARRVSKEKLEDVLVIGEHPHGDWHPSVAVDARDHVFFAWDAFNGDDFDIYLRILAGGRLGETKEVWPSRAFQGRVKLVSHNAAGVYIAWEEGGRNWGKPFRGLRTESLRDDAGPLHRFRLLRIAKVGADGKLDRFTEDFPMPSFRRAANREKVREGAERLGVFYERPELTVDKDGRLWVFYRHYYTPWLGITHRSHIEEGRGVYARHWLDDGWSQLYRLEIGQGDGMQRLELTSHKDGIAAVWTTGRTHRTANKRLRGLVTAAVKSSDKPHSGVRESQIIGVEGTLSRIQKSKRPTAKVDGKEYQLFFGDLHRHTDLSLCRVPIDGTIDDAYRYATEVAKLDFLGITDHTRDIAMGKPLSQLWWRCRKEVLRHQLGESDDMKFIPFYSYERSHGNTADHNVISLRPDMLRPYTYPVPKFWKELDIDTMTIPHQPIRRDTWNYQDDKLRPLVEIFQGARDTSIEEHVHRGLDKGYHLGFIASSDHMSTSASYACVWAEDASRESVFRSLQARRTYGATAKINLVVRAGDHWMGEMIEAKTTPEITFDAKGTAPIRSINLVVDGKIAETISPNEQVTRLRRKLDLSGVHYVYFHLVQADGNEAWSSPLWFDISK